MISVEKICYHYRGYPDTLQNVSFQMNGGEFLAVLGNNGVGKSTLLKCFNHILSADSGKVMLDGEDLLAMPILEVAKRVAFVSQNVPSTQMTVHDVVMLGRKPYMRWGVHGGGSRYCARGYGAAEPGGRYTGTFPESAQRRRTAEGDAGEGACPAAKSAPA